MFDKAVQQKMDIVVAMLFEEDIHDHINAIGQVMSHVPRYWSVSDKSREDISRLFSNPFALKHSVKFSLTAEGDQEYLDEMMEIVKEKGKAGGKKMMLPLEQGGVLHCIAAFAGEKEAVLQEYTLLCRDKNKPLERESNPEDETTFANETAAARCQPVFGYYINMDERGDFYADVRDVFGKTVFEIRAGNSLGEGESSIFDDGFMRNKADINGLKAYLSDIEIIPKDACILTSSAFESGLEWYRSQAESQANSRRHGMEP